MSPTLASVVPELLPTLLGLAVLLGIAVAALSIAGVPHRFAPVLALLRGAVQLAVISLILAGVIRSGWLVALALAVMFGVAASTAARRIRERPVVVAGTMLVAAAVAMGVVFLTGALAPTARYFLAIGGIVIGNTMSITTLAGRRFVEALDERWEEVEGWLALGASPRRATLDLGRRAVWSALVPTIDQTRTTGLVTLPGAFVGAIFGGVSPLEAGRFQLVVLGAIVAAGALAAVLLLAVLGDVRTRPAPLR